MGSSRGRQQLTSTRSELRRAGGSAELAISIAIDPISFSVDRAPVRDRASAGSGQRGARRRHPRPSSQTRPSCGWASARWCPSKRARDGIRSGADDRGALDPARPRLEGHADVPAGQSIPRQAQAAINRPSSTSRRSRVSAPESSAHAPSARSGRPRHRLNRSRTRPRVAPPSRPSAGAPSSIPALQGLLCPGTGGSLVPLVRTSLIVTAEQIVWPTALASSRASRPGAGGGATVTEKGPQP